MTDDTPRTTNKKPRWAEPYRVFGPCSDAWRSALAAKSYAAWWRKCHRGDWMLWAMARSPEVTQGSQEHVRLCWIVCRIWWELAYPWWYEYGADHADTRPEETIVALERWCLDPSAEAALAAEAAGAASAASAARTASAARAARTVWAAEEAAWAAGAAGVASAAALTQIAEIIREELPEPPLRPGDVP